MVQALSRSAASWFTAYQPKPDPPASPAGSGLMRSDSHDAILQDNTRIKINHHGDQATFNEVVAANVLKWLGVPHTPKVGFASGVPKFGFASGVPKGQGQTKVGIASELVEGFTDWGAFLLQHGSDYTPPENHKAYAAALEAYQESEAQRKKLETQNEALDAVLKNPRHYKTGRKESANPSDIPTDYRKALRAQLAAQDQMLNLLPATFRAALQEALFINEAVGNWDFANHARANSGFVIRNHRLVCAIAVDFGNSGANGFGGKTKAETPPETLAQAARVDDAYTRLPSPSRPHPLSKPLPGPRLKAPYTLDPRHFDAVSPGFGLVGHLPRSEVFAQLMRPLIQRSTVDPALVPDAACAVAHRLSCLPQGALNALLSTLCESGRQHPNAEVQAFFGHDWSNPQTVAADYEARFKAMIERVGTTPLERWRARHPVEAAAITAQVQRALHATGVTMNLPPVTPTVAPLKDHHVAACGLLTLPRHMNFLGTLRPHEELAQPARRLL